MIPIPLDLLVIGLGVGGFAIVIILLIASRKVAKGGGGDERLVILTPEGLTYMVDVTPLVPPALYTYSCPGTEICIMVARNPPLLLYDPVGKRTRKLWIGLEVDGLSITLSPEEAQTLSLVQESVGDFQVDDIVKLVRYAVEKKAYSDAVVLPSGFRVAFTYKIYPTVVKVLNDIIRSDSVALVNILSALRSAREAKALAEAVAIRKSAEASKWMYIGILVLLIGITIAIVLTTRR